MKFHTIMLFWIFLALMPIIYADANITKFCEINGDKCPSGNCSITLFYNGIITSNMTMDGSVGTYLFVETYAHDINYFVTCCQDTDCETNQYIFNPTSPNAIDMNTCPSTQTGMFMLYGLIGIGVLLLLIGMFFKKWFFIVFSGLIELGLSPTLGACNLQMGTILFVVSLIILIVAVSYMKFK